MDYHLGSGTLWTKVCPAASPASPPQDGFETWAFWTRLKAPSGIRRFCEVTRYAADKVTAGELETLRMRQQRVNSLRPDCVPGSLRGQ